MRQTAAVVLTLLCATALSVSFLENFLCGFECGADSNLTAAFALGATVTAGIAAVHARDKSDRAALALVTTAALLGLWAMYYSATRF